MYMHVQRDTYQVNPVSLILFYFSGRTDSKNKPAARHKSKKSTTSHKVAAEISKTSPYGSLVPPLATGAPASSRREEQEVKLTHQRRPVKSAGAKTTQPAAACTENG